MRVAGIADLHLQGRGLAAKLALLERSLLQARALGCKWVLNAGDTFDSPAIGDKHHLAGRIVGSLLEVVERVGLPWLTVAGNHCWGSPEHGCSLEAIRHPLWVSLLRPEGRFLEGAQGDGLAVWGLPWMPRGHHTGEVPYSEAIRDYLVRAQKFFAGFPRFPHLVLGHCEVVGSTSNQGYVFSSHEFSFTEEELAPADEVVWLGHVHNRHGFYLGAYTQLKLDERGNPDGFVIYDTNDGTETWYEADGPKYHKIPWEPAFLVSVAVKYDLDLHRDLIVAVVQPEDRDAAKAEAKDWTKNLRLEHVSPPRTERPKRVEGIAPDSSKEVLIQAWVSAGEGRDIPASGIEGCLLRLGEFAVPEEDVEEGGSLERIERVRIRNFGPFEDLTADFDYPPYPQSAWFGVYGPNGSGKSVLTSALLATAYDRWAYADRGTLQSLATGDPAEIYVEFRAGGACYRATRTLTGKTGTDLLLEREVPGGWEPVAGPRVKEAQLYMRRLLGTRSTFLATAFVPQRGEGDLVTAKDTERMAVVRQLLGLERFDAWAKLLEKPLKEVVQKVQELGGKLWELPRLRAELPQKRMALALAEKIHADRELELEQLEARRQEIQTMRARVEELCGELRVVEASLASLDGVRPEETVRALEAARQTVEGLRGVLDGCSMAGQAERHEIAAAHAQERELRAKREENAEKRGALEREIAGIRSERAAMTVDQENLERAGCRPQGFLPCPYIDGIAPRYKALEIREAELPQAMELLTSLNSADAILCRKLQVVAEKISGLFRSDVQTRTSQARLDLKQAEEQCRGLEALLARGKDKEYLLRRAEILEGALMEAGWSEASEAENTAWLEGLASQRAAVKEALRKVEEVRAEVRLREDKLTHLGGWEAELDEMKKRQEELSFLRTAFSGPGIPQLLIDSALPAIQAHVDELVANYFGSIKDPFTVTLATLVENKDGVAAETFAVAFTRRGKTHDVRSASDGEMDVVRILLRVAFLRYRQEVSGTSHRVLVLDEPTADMNVEFADNTMALIRDLGDQFEQVILTSHSSRVLRLADTRLELV